ncbi:MAG: hypothetical protein MJ137_02035 [Clostridia bacterium]|nr:hypothetical protein [Clostridia bacterium]
MKPTSIIFLIISVMLALVGLLLCFTATNMAADQGVNLFTQTGDADSNYTSVHEFDGESIKKLVINLSNVDINVYGGAESNRVELVNFPDGAYDLSISKSTLQLSDNANISNLIDIDNLKINFNGFRDYLHYFRYKDKERTVNLYFTDTASAITLSVSTEANVTLNDLRLNCDYKINVIKGNVSVSNVKTDSSMTIESTEDSQIELVSTSVNDLRIDGITAYANIKSSGFTRSMYIDIKSGSVDYNRMEDDFTGFNLYLRAAAGTISYFNEIKYGDYSEKNYIDIGTGDEEPGTDDGDTDVGDEPSEGEEPENPTGGSSSVEAYSVTIILGEGNIKVY